MNRRIAALTLSGLLSSCPLFALAVEKATAESAVPPTVLPGVNQSGSSKADEDKASKKGEEASGSNSGADSETLKKDSGSSGDSKKEKKPKQ
ncbi:hypothetical protein [Pseudomonas sp. B21-053]|uniref:hypothetical protein n=1 Tax=Pseudomonas sp. B21-053 TaxID=2895493 RepID=UPI00223164F5|nr:hypothetical protein [Pseudomonas sp. B21-053]UZE14766.1 hypothetical protein LOY68_14530 [Pseudomonas sp. B21-053]